MCTKKWNKFKLNETHNDQLNKLDEDIKELEDEKKVKKIQQEIENVSNNLRK